MPLPYLTDREIEGICRPLKQYAAQIRYLRDTLKLPVDRRPDGSPLVRRIDWDRSRDVHLQGGTRPTRGPNWSVAP